MYLKSIEIQGFKSFAQKTLLNFNTGVTAIVGPNGSGKSNISDAVRWVLGEQKVKQLRGSAMQDVIFAGTEVRKPQGFAYVSLTLDNADRTIPLDYNEINVSRRLYRSGESEYMLNSQQVRLKDIHELFYDLGVGRDGYSIISQGQVETIVSGRAEERRGIFDEAAGIVKFKARKQAAEKRLDGEEASLLRINDIVGELEGRIEPLREQSETAKKYLGLKEEQKKLDLNLFIRDTGDLLSSIEKTAAARDIAKGSFQDASDEKERLRSLENDISERAGHLTEEIRRSTEDISKARLLKQNLKGQIDVLSTEIRSEEESLVRFESELSDRERDAEKNRLGIKKCLRELKSLSDGLSAIKGEQEITEDAGRIEDMLIRVSGLTAELESRAGTDIFPANASSPDTLSEGTVKDLPGERVRGTGSDGKAAASGEVPHTGRGREPQAAEAADEDEEEFSFVMPSWMSGIKGKRSDLSGIKEKEERNSIWLSKATEEYNALTEKLNSLRKSYDEAQQSLSYARAQYESQLGIAERYEGFGDSVKSVMQKKDSIRGICGTVADIISTDKKYELAIETALGGRLQNIVTESEQAARECIEYLRRTKKGRATFLPLDALKVKKQPEYERALREKGAVAIAGSLVTFAGEYRGLSDYLLANVLVAEDLAGAIAIAGKYRHSLRIVTLAGDLLSPGGAMSGGSYRNSHSLMGRTRILAELKEGTIAKRDRLIRISETMQDMEKQISEKSAEIDRLTEAAASIKEERNRLSFSIMSDVRVKVSELIERTGFVCENAERLLEEAEGCLSKSDETRSAISSALKNIGERKEKAGERNLDILHVDAEEKKLEESLESLNKERDELTRSRSSYYERREELDGELLDLQKEIIRLENTLEKDQQKLDSASEYIWSEYELSLSSAREYEDDSLGSTAKIRQSLAAVKNDIKALGSVNINAIDEYKEVSGRYEFLKEQQKDLVESRASIERIIKELDESMKKRFREQFAVIREQFAVTFGELFGGGRADLRLCYDADDAEADELDAGIAIEAQPPGKKLKNLMQLSGGEKALTAIALLFAIQKLKPSPFCLLDEIEASLDDINVERFAEYLKNISGRTQFIVITHRRGTMEAADRLYGVTMQERGISKLISVDLISDELD